MKRHLLPASLFLVFGCSSIIAAPSKRFLITDQGAVANDQTINTQAIQKTIDAAAANSGGGIVVVPEGTFVSGALFLKPGVDLHLEKDAVLKCSTDMANFPPRRTRIEGHFEESFTPAFINADQCDNLTINGTGTLDGSGMPIWELFWKLRNAAPDKTNFKNLSIPRARLTLIENSKGVTIDGISFKDSQFWNLHIYKCQNVTIKNISISVPDDYKQAPSSDGIDIDSSQDITIQSCTFSVTDDCIAMKGSKGPHALEDKDSPPVERVSISDCTFKRGHAAVTLGSEATIVKDVTVKNCKVLGHMALMNFKLRPDTPQHYENIHYSDILLDNEGGTVISMQPWKQYFDLKGEAPPQSIVRNISLSNITGKFGSFGTIDGNKDQTSISDITLKNIHLELKKDTLKLGKITDLKTENVVINGKPVSF
ncbi:MAG: glycosyl hydrolase family 28 protein [Luteolibacter sp.]